MAKQNSPGLQASELDPTPDPEGSSLDNGKVKQIQYGIENSSLVEPQVCADFSQKERIDQ